MTSKELEAIFASRSTRRGDALVLDERWTLALIDEAQNHDVAVVGIAQYRPDEDAIPSALSGRTLDLAVDRSQSWRHAREFVSYLSGRGVLFEMLLEAPETTQGMRLRDGMVPSSGFLRPQFVSVFLPVVFMVVLMVVVFMMGRL